MPRVNLEYFYLSGLPIDLTNEGLGRVYQPRIKDFIHNQLDMQTFVHPFLLTKEMIMNRNEGVDNVLADLGRLKFLMVYDELTKQSREKTNQTGVVDLLVESLKLIYQTDNIMVVSAISAVIVDKNLILTDDNFDFLANLVIEMMRIDIKEMRKKIEESRKEENESEDPRLKEIERRRKEYEEKLKGKKNDKDFSLLDIVNIVVHSQSVIDYDRVFDLTVYQLKNSYETFIKKESFNVSLMHRISPNFQPSDDFKLWEEKTYVVKSVLNK